MDRLATDDQAERYTLRNARHLAADYIKRTVRMGDIVVDATMGNGADTLFLAGLVGENGHVYGFDVQQEAIDRTRERLEAADMLARATLLLAGHETMAEHVHESPMAVMFNLGWLPGAAHRITTRTETTLKAVAAATEILAPGGMVSVCIYPGHEEGQRELTALLEFAAGLSVQKFNVLHHHFLCAPPHTPRLILIQKNKG